MAKSLSDFLTEHPVDRDAVEAHKHRMLADIEKFRSIDNSPDGGEGGS